MTRPLGIEYLGEWIDFWRFHWVMDSGYVTNDPYISGINSQYEV
jgi:hypothetical protein